MVRIPGALTENGPCKSRVHVTIPIFTGTQLSQCVTLSWPKIHTHRSLGFFLGIWCDAGLITVSWKSVDFFYTGFFLPVRWFIRSLHFIKAKLPLRPQNCGIAEITRYAPLSKIIEDLQQKYKLVSSLEKHYYDNRLRGNDKRLINCTGP